MSVKEVVSGVYQIPLRMVNAYLLVLDEQVVLIDAGVPGSAAEILTAVSDLGRQPSDIKHILVTHLHADHTGSLAALKAATGAPATMHPLDAEKVRQGVSMRPAKSAPGLLNKLLVNVANVGMRLMSFPDIEAVEIEREVLDGDVLEACGNLQVVHLPGHSAGQIGFLWPAQGGVLFGGDVASMMFGSLGYPPLFEDQVAGEASLARVAELSFEVACLGHGRVITSGASAQFRAKWG